MTEDEVRGLAKTKGYIIAHAKDLADRRDGSMRWFACDAVTKAACAVADTPEGIAKFLREAEPLSMKPSDQMERINNSVASLEELARRRGWKA